MRRITVVSVDESLAYGKRAGRSGSRLEVNGDEGSRHGTGARKEKWPSLFNEAGELITNCIDSEIGPVVADPHCYSCWPVVVCCCLFRGEKSHWVN